MKHIPISKWLPPAVLLLLVCAGAGGPLADARAEDQEQHDEHEEGHVELSPQEIQEFGIMVDEAGSGQVLLVRTLPAEVRVNENRLAHIVPRYSGIATEVRVDVGAQRRRWGGGL